MSFRSWRSSKQPSQAREPEKPTKKTLQDACRDMKSRLGAETRAKAEAALQTRYRAEEDAVMAEVYGPNWKVQMPRWALEQERREREAIERARPVKVQDPVTFEEAPEANVVPLRSTRQEKRQERKLERERRRKAS